MSSSQKFKNLLVVSSLFLPLLLSSLKINPFYIGLLIPVLLLVNILYLLKHKPEKKRVVIFVGFSLISIALYVYNY